VVWPRWWCGREIEAAWRGDDAVLVPLVNEVVAQVQRDLGSAAFRTGSWQFNGEWNLVTRQMAALGLAQTILARPAWRPALLPVIEACVEQLLATETRAYDAQSWGGEDPLSSLAGPHGHVGYLGYAGVALNLYRAVGGQRFASESVAITDALARRLEASPIGLLETYPGECYPVDNTTAFAAIALFDRATGADHSALLRRLLENLATRYLERTSGLLVQAVDARTGAWRDQPRASGSALAVYFIGFVERALSRRIYNALQNSCGVTGLGFAAVNEYPATVTPGRGDVDSGPIVFGLSVSGTGFALAGPLIHGDAPFFAGLWRTSFLLGYPVECESPAAIPGATARGRRYALGGPLGTAIMLAMLTAGSGAVR